MPSLARLRNSGMHETEALIRHAAAACARVGIECRPARVSKLVRRLLRDHEPAKVLRILDRIVLNDAATWERFERYALGGYADPTGAEAAHRVDLERRLEARPTT